MEPVRRALWYIDGHYAEKISLDDVVKASGLSRFHLSRVFTQFVGVTVTAYLRKRRLSEAAKRLATGDDDVTSVAFAVGYGALEAFSRAFKAEFDVTPQAVRASRNLADLALTEPNQMTVADHITPPEPTYRDIGPLLLAGLRTFQRYDALAEITAQWSRFAPHIATLAPAGAESYGVCFAVEDREDGFDYLAAVPVTSLEDLPEDLVGARIGPRRVAAFAHRDHVATIADTCSAIISRWIPTAPVVVESKPISLIERYGPSFDPSTGRGEIEILIPLAD